MRIDAHQHFWRYSADEYSWITDRLAALRADFLPADLASCLERHDFDGCVAVQARQSLEETRWLLELAEASTWIRGVVGWVDLRAPEVADDLARFSRHPKLVGVRHVVQDEPDDEFLLREDFRRGISALSGRGLVYDLLVQPRQLPAAVRFVELFPDQDFVLDHLAKPDPRGALEPWAGHVRALARHPRLSCKVSGLVTEGDWRDWTAEQFEPVLDVVFEAFGEDRVLFGSDWPVCLLAADYDRVLGLVAGYAERLSDAARAKLFGANAARIYRLEA